jgi:SAM-dependent MidA family methyltransferase
MLNKMPDVSPLTRLIQKTIALDGPISLASYMGLCLSHPIYGYYMSRDPFGAKGDFTTAPEISQLFGEIVGLWVLEQWQSFGCPEALQLVELGPGRGTLMSDIMRTIKSIRHGPKMIAIDLVEISPHLRSVQRETLQPYQGHKNWHDNLGDLPKPQQDMPVILLANEFFDALPVKQWVYRNRQWYQVVIALDDDGHLQKALSQCEFDPESLLLHHQGHIRSFDDGQILESSPARIVAMETLITVMKERDGAALIIDYGYRQPPFGDTVQALYQHKPCPVTDYCGLADLTAHVDFLSLENCAKNHGITLTHTTTQQNFLLSYGLLERAGQLGAGQTDKVQNDIRIAVERLAGDDHMGHLFKVLGLASKSSHARLRTH